MDEVDVILLSCARNETLKQTTIAALESLKQSETGGGVRLRPLVVESARELRPYEYPGCETWYPEEPFGFNRYLNLAARHTSAPFLCFCNNDLLFRPAWATNLVRYLHGAPDVMSCSPADPWLHGQQGIAPTDPPMLGYEKARHFAGWCFLVRREIFAKIGEFDERFVFWYADDDYLETLKAHRVPHALVPSAEVFHLGGRTLYDRTTSEATREGLTSLQWLYFDYKWRHHSRLLHALKVARYHLARRWRRGRRTEPAAQAEGSGNAS